MPPIFYLARLPRRCSSFVRLGPSIFAYMLLASIYLLKQTDKNWLTIDMIFGQVIYIFIFVIATLPVSLVMILTFTNLRKGLGRVWKFTLHVEEHDTCCVDMVYFRFTRSQIPQ
jgi:hypothetical protein